jgi:hypothetical protein
LPCLPPWNCCVTTPRTWFLRDLMVLTTSSLDFHSSTTKLVLGVAVLN